MSGRGRTRPARPALRAGAVGLAALLLAGCVGPAEFPAAEMPARRAAPVDTGAALFGPPRPALPARPNAEIARDILDLGFRMESGREIPVLSRFEGPVRVRVTGPVPPGAEADLARLLARLRAEARLDIARARSGEPAQITVEFLPGARMRTLVPEAACFVVPRVSGWGEYRSARRTARLDWTTLTRRERIVIFIPNDTTPQETRDCLHEELGQALGPLNDLYRLHDSVFNDDNFQTTLTGFDMLVLAAWNAPELRSGMSPDQVAARLPAVLARLNPAGGTGLAPPRPLTPPEWTRAVETALGAGASDAARRDAAARAVAIARANDWRDARLGFALFLRARFSTPAEVDLAVAALNEARSVFAALPGGALHAAHAEMQLAVRALAVGAPDEALALASAALPHARAAENAALVATLLMLQAEAFDRTGRADAARAVRVDSLPYARYGFGSDAAAQARLAETAAIGQRAEGVTRRGAQDMTRVE